MSAPKALPAIFNGDANACSAIHQWIKYHKGTPRLCEACGLKDRKNYHWANVSGEYKREFSDWKRLCVSCHTKHDKKFFRWMQEYCKQGHKLYISKLKIRKIWNYDKTAYSLAVACRTCHGLTNHKGQKLKERK